MQTVALSYIIPWLLLSYHIKYMFVGDLMKNEVECIIRRLRPALQMRLRFIAHLNIEEINATWDKRTMNIGAHKNEVNQLCAFLVELLSTIKSYSC
jgi:hypothetical protein